MAADIWLPDGSRVELDHPEVVGRPSRRLFDKPRGQRRIDDRYDRQARLFGDRGQEILTAQKVGVIGAGGAGSLIVEYLSRLGVGHLVVIDPDRIDPTNLPRVVDSTRRDTRPLLTHRRMPQWIQSIGERRRTPKVDIAERVARKAQPGIRFEGVVANVVEQSVAERLTDCDYLFLAADSAQARLVFNALVHQYLIPGVQVGAKAQVDKETGDLLDLFSVMRPLIPGRGCFWCNGLISPAKLQEKATSYDQLRKQRYVDDEDVPAPSVITLNAVASALATNDYLMNVTGLGEDGPLRWTKVFPREGEFAYDKPRRDESCRECSASGRSGIGRGRVLPTR